MNQHNYAAQVSWTSHEHEDNVNISALHYFHAESFDGAVDYINTAYKGYEGFTIDSITKLLFS